MFATFRAFLASRRTLDALGQSHALIEFTPEGVVLAANTQFLTLFGYSAAELVGQHHRKLMDPAEAAAPAYAAFWASLREGHHQTAEFRRCAKDGREVWLQASYAPVRNRRGQVIRVVKMATDITRAKLDAADAAGQIAAIGRSQAVIQFALDGTILDANENFLTVMGYTAAEVRGRHHRMFVDPKEVANPDYAAFWDRLRRGEAQVAEYRRLGKGGKEVFIQATYTPIFDPLGRPFKVVKYATDITAERLLMADCQGQMSAIRRSQAVIEFDLDGSVLAANDIFLTIMGYRLDEVQGKHHRMFVAPAESTGPEYAQFWDALRRGEVQTGDFNRIGKAGKEVGIHASYTPIIGPNGTPFKIVKYATDITQLIELRRAAAKGATQTLQNVQAVATAAEEMTASVGEITRSLARSRDLVTQIESNTSLADAATQRLQQGASSLDAIIQFIQRIAAQTTLLALNATIEAARAGEAGKGFAVVAGEVKALAAQTSQAAERISREITGMQGISSQVVQTLTSISDSVTAVQEMVTTVASALEEQNVVTAEISHNMQVAAQGVSEVTESIARIAGTA